MVAPRALMPAGRRAVRARRLGLASVVLGAVLLAGCGSTRSPESRPAELAEIARPLPTRVLWRARLPSARGAFLQPAVLENAIYAAGGDGTLSRFVPDTGREQWSIDVGVPISAGVGSDGFVVAVGSAAGDVLAFGADGKPLWRAKLPSDITAAPLVGRGLVVVRSADHRVVAFDAQDGRRRWAFQRSMPPLTLRAPVELAFGGENVLVGMPDGRLVALAQSNGAVRWESIVAEPKGATEVERLIDVIGRIGVDTREACAAAFLARVACADAASGDVRWTREVPAATGVGMDAQRVYVVDQRSVMHALSRDSGGAALWRSSGVENRRLSGPLPLRGGVLAGDFEGYVHVFSPEDGAIVARFDTGGGAITAAPREWAGAAVVQTSQGSLMLLQLGR